MIPPPGVIGKSSTSLLAGSGRVKAGRVHLCLVVGNTVISSSRLSSRTGISSRVLFGLNGHVYVKLLFRVVYVSVNELIPRVTVV